MVADSRALEDHEPAQAFDKVARALESLLTGCDGSTQAEKWSGFSEGMVRHEELWQQYRQHQSTPNRLAASLHYYVQPINRTDADRLLRYGQGFEKGVGANARVEAAAQLARFVALLRNKRFHGDPAFSGRNFRVLPHTRVLVTFLRGHVAFALDERPLG